MISDNGSTISTSLARARAHHQAGRLTEAERGYVSLLKIAPAHPKILYLAGIVALQGGELDKARSRLEKASALAQNDPHIWTGLGQLEEFSDNPGQALACYDKALQLAPDTAFVIMRRAFLLEMADQVEVASEEYRHALEASFAGTQVDNFSPSRNIYHCCTQKTASQWVRRIFSDPVFYKTTGLLMQPYVQLGLNKARLDEEWPARTAVTHLYVNHDTFRAMPKPGDYKAFFMIRDPRDCVVSWYHSARYSYNASRLISFLREQLNARSEPDGLVFMIEWLDEAGFFTAQRSWAEAEKEYSDFRIFRYEDLNLAPRKFLDKLLDYLEVPLSVPDRDRLSESHAWEKLSGGRKKGEQNIKSHYRKAKTGDWKAYLQGKTLSRFNEITADLIPVLGYEY